MHKPVILHPSCHHKKDNAYADCLGPHTSIGTAYYSAAQFLFCKSGDQVWGGSVGFMLR
jgi:hypothetical protein